MDKGCIIVGEQFLLGARGSTFFAGGASHTDGHHNLNCAKLKQAKLKLKLCKN